MSHKFEMPTKEELETLYHNTEKPVSKAEIAKIYEVSRPVVDRWFKEHNIRAKDHDTMSREVNSHKLATKEELYDLYVNKQMSITDIAFYYHVTRRTLSNWLKDYKIQTRSLSEADKVNKQNRFRDIYFDKNTIQEAYDRFKNVTYTAKHLNISLSHMKKLMKLYDIKTVKFVRSLPKEGYRNIDDEYYGFVYAWYDSKYDRYYIGVHQGNENDGYICSSTLMLRAYRERPEDFKRTILQKIYDKIELYESEKYWIEYMKKNGFDNDSYNLTQKTK